MTLPTETECRLLAEHWPDDFEYDGDLHFALGRTRICICPGSIIECDIEDAYTETNSYGLAGGKVDLLISDALGLAALVAKCREVTESAGLKLIEYLGPFGEPPFTWQVVNNAPYAIVVSCDITPWAALLASRSDD